VALPFVIGVAAVLVVLYAVGHGLTTLAAAPKWASTGLPAIHVTAIGEIAVIVFLLPMLPELAKVSLRKLGFVRPSTSDVLWAIAGAIAMVLVTDGLASLLQNALHAKVSEQAVNLYLSVKSAPGKFEFALLGIVIAPIAEETAFRVLIFNAARKYGGFWFGAAVSGLLFGLAHAQPGLSLLQSFILLLPLAMGGAILCGVYAKTRNAYASMITHGLFNAVSLVALLFAPQFGK
jgi:membrane protease YdiL (CAAX protease family)